MNNIFIQGPGGVKSLARPSIHNHQGCVFAEGERMARYGIRSNNRENNPPNDQGTDEVDNILSKPSAAWVPPSQKNGYRRNSLDILNKSTEFDNVSDDEQEADTENRCSDVSQHSIATPNTSSSSRYTSYQTLERLDPLRDSEREELELDNRQVQSKVPIYLIGIIVVVCAVICSSGLNIGHISNTSKSTYDQAKFYTDISSLGEKHNVDENSLLQVQAGVSTIFEKGDTGSFMFVYNSNTRSFNPTEFNEFMNDISLAAAKYLRNDSSPLHYTRVEGTKLDMVEHSELICRYRGELAATGVMLVRHLEAVPAALAMAFHYYCDEYNPLVKKTAIFFTFNVATCAQGPYKKSAHAAIEKCLSEKWVEVPTDSIGPLLTRVVSVVIDLTSEF